MLCSLIKHLVSANHSARYTEWTLYYKCAWGADSMAFNISSPNDPDEELAIIEDWVALHSFRSKLWHKGEDTRVS